MLEIVACISESAIQLSIYASLTHRITVHIFADSVGYRFDVIFCRIWTSTLDGYLRLFCVSSLLETIVCTTALGIQLSIGAVLTHRITVHIFPYSVRCRLGVTCWHISTSILDGYLRLFCISSWFRSPRIVRWLRAPWKWLFISLCMDSVRQCHTNWFCTLVASLFEYIYIYIYIVSWCALVSHR